MILCGDRFILVISMHRLFAKRFEFGVAETAGGGGPVDSYSRSSSCYQELEIHRVRHVGPMDMEKVVGAGSLTHVHITRALGIYDHPAFIPRMFHSVVFLSTSTLVHSGPLHLFLFLFSFLLCLFSSISLPPWLLSCAGAIATK
jgi:hypothetical protein